MYAASYEGGNGWESPTEFVSPNGLAKNITIGLYDTDKLLVVWLGLPEDVVYYQFSQDQGRSWSPPRPIPGVWGGYSVYGTRLDTYSIATDVAGDIHLVLVGRTQEKQNTLNVLHLTWNGSIWSSPEAVATLIGDVPEWPRIAVGNGNQLHVVWFVRDQATIWQSDLGKYQIWYAHGSASAPYVDPVSWPTPTPTPTPQKIISTTSTPTPKPSPTATPTLDPSAAQLVVPERVASSIYTDNDEVILLGISLLPAILIIGIVVSIVLRQRS
jgi:hypothetical protein